MSLFFDYDSRWIYPLNSPLSRTVVISDSMYEEYQREQAKQEITLLESKLNRYKRIVADIEKEINDIKTQHKLPSDEDAVWNPGPTTTFKDTPQGQEQ